MSYTVKVRPPLDVYTVLDFRDAVKSGAFIDDDGYGYPVRNGLANDKIVIRPSQVTAIPEDATHVVWFNR
jgi:hypothetical protein